MPMSSDNFDSRKRVNVLKKVKVDGDWKLYPAIIEPNGKLKDRVRVQGKIEIHQEGTYFIEWREGGRRRRRAIAERAQVIERARLKSLELEGVVLSPPTAPVQVASSFSASLIMPPLHGTNLSVAANTILAGLHAYLQEISTMLQTAGPQPPALPTPMQLIHAPFPEQAARSAGSQPTLELLDSPATANEQDATDIPPKTQTPNKKILLAEAIEAFLKNIKPPQREPKTYDEYRLVLYKFRDTCKKEILTDINRDDLLDFIRHLFSIGNEARTIRNRIAIIEQVLKLNGVTGLLQPRDKPAPVNNTREMYQPEELEALFKVCSPDEQVRYLFFLLTGERDKEVRYTSWNDIDFSRQCVRVTAKKRLAFKPKDKEEREIPVPAALMQALQ
jgi:hypothetical protein